MSFLEAYFDKLLIRPLMYKDISNKKTQCSLIT